MQSARKLWQRVRYLLPLTGFHFDRPLVLLQSDDWGRVGLQDRSGLEELQSAGITLGDRAYDFYSLETSEDLRALCAVLKRHRDSSGRPPCLQMNFMVANLNFQNAAAGQLSFLPLAEGLPAGWKRPNLIEGYRSGIDDGVFTAALHGTSHFCRPAVERALMDSERGDLLRRFWRAGTPYVYWRMPWIGYEYWDSEKAPDERFLDSDAQIKSIGEAVGWFAKLFSLLPRSACAPGYRANDDTHRAWSQHGIQIAQNGPGTLVPPHFERYGLLHLSRTVEFEPATDAAFSLDSCLSQAERCFALGIPVVVSVHSINFHSTVKDFRSRTLQVMDEFLTAVESRHPDVLYLHDADLHQAIEKGQYEAGDRMVQVNVTRKTFVKSAVVRNSL